MHIFITKRASDRVKDGVTLLPVLHVWYIMYFTDFLL